MNKSITLICFVIMLAICGSAFSQQMSLTGFGGYTFQDKVYAYNGDVTIRDGAHYGAMLSVRPNTTTSLELTYFRQDTEFAVTDYSSIVVDNYNIAGSMNYIMLGASHSPDFTAPIAPYGGFMIGAAVVAPQEDYSDVWQFAVGGKLGAIFNANEKIGILIQTQLMVPVQGVGFAVGCSGSGCGSGLSTSSSATQFGFTGGIEFKIQ
ncbi:MAG: hypothetical protein WBG42_01080 [Cryomorphaceae bacterium]